MAKLFEDPIVMKSKKKLNIFLVILSALSGIAASCDTPAQIENENNQTEIVDYSKLPQGSAECSNEELNVEEARVRNDWILSCFKSKQAWPELENRFVLLKYRHDESVWNGPLNAVASCDLAKDWVPVAICDATTKTKGLDFVKMGLSGVGLEDVRDLNTIRAYQIYGKEGSGLAFRSELTNKFEDPKIREALLKMATRCASKESLELMAYPSELNLELDYIVWPGQVLRDLLAKDAEAESISCDGNYPANSFYVPVWPYDEVFTPDLLKPDQVAGRNEWFNKCFPDYRRGEGCDERATTYRLARHKYLFIWKAPTISDEYTTCDNWIPVDRCAQAQTSDEYDYVDDAECEEERQFVAKKEPFDGFANKPFDIEQYRRERKVPFISVRLSKVLSWRYCFELLEGSSRHIPRK